MIVAVSPSRNPADAPNKTRIRRAKRHTRKLERQIESAIANGKIGKAEYKQRRLLASFDARLTGCIQANRKLPRPHRVHKTRLVQHAEAINPWVRSNEPVRALVRMKANGSFRPILSYGFRGRAVQLLLKRAMQPFLRVDARQHATTNGGRDAAIAKINDAIRAGYKWFVRLDLREFYQHVDERRLADFVPMPRGVILNTLGPPKDIVLGHSSLAVSPYALMRKCRKGLSQGASSSPIIAEIVVAWILGKIPTDALVINFADDFAVMGRSKREVVALQKLWQAPFGAVLSVISSSNPSPLSDELLMASTFSGTFSAIDIRNSRANPPSRIR